MLGYFNRTLSIGSRRYLSDVRRLFNRNRDIYLDHTS